MREKDGKEKLLPTYKQHLLCDEKGLYPAELNDWEIGVLNAELDGLNSKFWYRNPNRPSQDSLGIAYKNGDETSIVRPDFLFFSVLSDSSVVVDIVDPHGIHLSDALPKLKGLAQYAESHAQAYRRIESVAQIGSKLRILNLTKKEVREAIDAADDAASLYRGALANDYS